MASRGATHENFRRCQESIYVNVDRLQAWNHVRRITRSNTCTCRVFAIESPVRLFEKVLKKHTSAISRKASR